MNLGTPDETREAIAAIFRLHFPDRSEDFLGRVFARVCDLFAGRYPGYQRCDTLYHDLAHTCQATLALVRLLDGHLKSRQPPALAARDYELAVAAILLHDSGYLKKVGDHEGTGAKYTLIHVERSAEFAAKFLPPLGVTPQEVEMVQKAIYCTGVKAQADRVTFRDERERFIGQALGTGDVLGQMAAPNYPQRLPSLYREFAEAVRHEGDGRAGELAYYTSAEDLLRKTRWFYENYVKQMLETQWGGVHRALTHHFPDGRNRYFEAIEANLAKIDSLVRR